MKIAVFTEGTILMHKGAIGRTRAEIVQQVRNDERSVKDYADYVPIGNAAEKIRKWVEQGAEIIYMTSRKDPKEVGDIQNVIDRNNFPKGTLEYRRQNEEYKDIAERIIPDILIEDDCESIGGEKEMICPHIGSEMKEKIVSIAVKEFGGIDYLSDNVESLRTRK